ncbi:MAG TPA: L,D-transpeptidase family protein [Acidimicrobiales bacterium]|nr:L,D-transpeptidase family protein [Acidimicrobiales bacterium]
MTRRPSRAVAAIASLVVATVLGTGSAGSVTTTTTAPTTTTTAACPGAPATGVASAAAQLLVVSARSALSTAATLSAYELVDGCWARALGPFFARVGRHGLRLHRHEGDGTTPIGVFTIGATLLGVGPDPHDAYPYRRLVCGDWWDEDPSSASYDELVRVPCGASPGFSGEPMWLEGNVYPILAVIGFNPRRVPGLGSGIFLHLDYGRPTDGCVALLRPALYRVLAWLRPGDHPEIAIRVGR